MRSLGALAIVILLASACSGTAEWRDKLQPEGISPALSPEQVVEKIVSAARGIYSLRRDSSATVRWRDHQVSSSGVWLLVGGDYYTGRTFQKDEDNPSEMLFYGGIIWKRDGEGRWVSAMPSGRAPVDTSGTNLSWEGMRDEQRTSLIYGIQFDSEVSNLRRLPDETADDGGSLIHLSGAYASWTSFPAAALYPDHLGPDELEPDIDVQGEGTMDIWVDPRHFRIVRTKSVLSPVDDGTHEVTDAAIELTDTFSQFNEAELPGTLPE